MSKHRLVAIGDSLTQGFMSGAIFATDRSYPAMIAEVMGLQGGQFRFPSFNSFGGLPVNLEYLVRRLQENYGSELSTLEVLGASFRVRSLMDEAEDYWERGGGTIPQSVAGTFHNLASWGMTVDDAVFLTAGYASQRCAEPTSDNLFNQVPENAFYRTALTVLNPAQRTDMMDRTAVRCVKDLADDGGIENLLVALGANNALGTVTRLQVNLTDDSVISDPNGARSRFNLWRAEHFAHAYRELVNRLDQLDVQRVFLATVPHVTIPPLARGVGTQPEDRLPADPRYFKFYTYYWITDERFDPDEHPHLTGDQARMIDQTIDAYNATIREAVATQTNKGKHWFLVDLAGALDRLAFRRYREINEEPPGGFYQFPAGWTKALHDAGLPDLTTKFLGTAEGRLNQGGLISLDGVHPTTMCYGLMAHEFIQVMHTQAHVPFINPQTGAERPDPQIDFAAVLRRDALVRTPPGLLDDVLGILNWLEDWVGVSALLGQLG